MELSRRQRAALASIADTFAPGLDGLPAASDLGVPEAFVEALDRHPRRAEVREILQLLSVWELAALPLRRFSSLHLAERERVLRSWRDSPRRAEALGVQGAAEGRPAPLLRPPGRAAHRDRLPRPARARADTGAVHPRAPVGRAAADVRRLRRRLGCGRRDRGRRARGGGSRRRGARGRRRAGVQRRGARLAPTPRISRAPQLRRRTRGSTSSPAGVSAAARPSTGRRRFVPPDEVRAEWAEQGVPAFASDELTRSLDAVEARMDVNGEHGEASGRDRTLERGAEALGWHVGAQPRNVRGCDQNGVCGYCGFGCPLRAKQDTVQTWLADAVAAGARVFVGTRARRVLVVKGAAVGVDAGPVQVRARAVVVACGAFHTPALLRRSGLMNGSIGRNLHFHPVTLLVGEFEQEIRPWEGTLQARYSEEHADSTEATASATRPRRSIPGSSAPGCSGTVHARASSSRDAIGTWRRSSRSFATATEGRSWSGVTASRRRGIGSRDTTSGTCAPGSSGRRGSSRRQGRSGSSRRTRTPSSGRRDPAAVSAGSWRRPMRAGGSRTESSTPRRT